MPTKAQQNRTKYLKAPTLEQVESFITKLKVSGAQFERFYGIPDGTIRQIKLNKRSLPAKFWHIIYEQVKPAYGSGFLDQNKAPVQTVTKVATIRRERPRTNSRTNTVLDELL